jgi:hypothetical protein
MCDFLAVKRVRNDASNIAAARQHRIGDGTHDA